jgi:hypothetical protein
LEKGEKKMDIQTLTANDIVSVYSGKPGECCCGCKGTHYRSSSSPLESTIKTSDTMVLKVLRGMQANEELVQVDEGHIWMELRGRLFIAYLKE